MSKDKYIEIKQKLMLSFPVLKNAKKKTQKNPLWNQPYMYTDPIKQLSIRAIKWRKKLHTNTNLETNQGRKGDKGISFFIA